MTTTPIPVEPRRGAARRDPVGWTTGLVRVAVTAEAAVVAGQALLAGQFINGNYAALAWHQVNGIIAGVVVAVMLVAVTLGWWWGGGPGWAPLVCVVLTAAVGEQIHAGFTRLLWLHVPLGVAITVAMVLLLIWAWRAAPAPKPDPARGAAGPGRA